MKFRCPYCQAVFEPQERPFCPACSKLIAMPHPNRGMNSRSSHKRGLSPDLRQKQRELRLAHGKGAESWTRITRSPRYVAALVILFVVMGVVLTQRATRHNTETVHRFNPHERARSDLANLRIALEVYHRDCGRYPSTRENLLALLRRPRAKGWDGPYIKTLIPDPWKNSYRYSLSKGVMRLSSDGPDGRPDTGDDIEATPPDMNLIYPTNHVGTSDAPPDR